MNTPKLVSRHGITLAFGLIIAAVVTSVVSVASRGVAVFVFVGLVVIWVGCGISFTRRQVDARGGRLGVFTDPRDWTAEALPLEFRFITHETPIDEVIGKIGPSSKRPPIPRGAVRYDWPDGRIVFIYARSSASGSGRVDAIQVYREQSDIPIDEII